MKKFSYYLKLLSRILRHLPFSEKIIILLLAGVIFASIIRLAFPLFSKISLQSAKIYTEGLMGQIKLLNPVFIDFNDVDRDIASLIFSGLVKYDPQTKQFIPDLADQIQRSKDNLAYLVKLKQNIFWHDDEPVNADDVIFTFRKVIQDPGFKNLNLKSAFNNIDIEKIDDKTVSFNLDEANSFFISYLTTGLLPYHILKDTPVAELEKNIFNKNPIGTGPYKFKRFETYTILLETFPKFYGKKSNIALLRFFFFQDAKKLISEKNTLNAIPKIHGRNFKKDIEDKRFQLIQYRLPQYMAVFFNLDREILSKKKIRQALVKSIDKQNLRNLLGAEVETVDTPYLDQKPDEWINQFDPEDAKKILKDSGYSIGADGFLRNSKDEILTFSLLAKQFPKNSVLEEEILIGIDFLKNSWQKAGVKIDVKREEDNNFYNLVGKREYDLLLLGQNMGYNFDAFAFWHSSQRDENGLNFSQLRSFRVDSLIEDLRLTFDIEKKNKKIEELKIMLSDEVPALFLYSPIYYYAVDNRISGFPSALGRFGFHGDRFNNFTELNFNK